jgi:RND superfamily putative drug exporter
VTRRPVAGALVGLTAVLAVAAPVLDMRTWPQDASSTSTSNTTRRAYDLVAGELGPGANGPFVAVVRGSGRAAAETVARTVSAFENDPGVDRVAGPVATPDHALTVVQAEPSTAPTDERTVETMQRVRQALPDGVELTGWTPFLADISGMLAQRLWWVIGFVVAVSFFLLMVMFRSVVVPAKAALLNVLSISGAYGVLTAVFQWGWGNESARTTCGPETPAGAWCGGLPPAAG